MVTITPNASLADLKSLMHEENLKVEKVEVILVIAYGQDTERRNFGRLWTGGYR